MAANTPRPTTTASTRYFSTAMSPNMKAPLSETGRGAGMMSGPHTTWIACSATISPPMVTRICFRWSPYTGRISTRSKNQPSNPATAMAARIAGAIAVKFVARLSACIIDFIGISTDTAA